MNRLRTFPAAGMLAVLCAAIPAYGWDYKEEAKEAVKHTFAAGATTLDVNNVNGSVTVIGDSGNTMRVEGEKIIRGEDKQDVERGKREVTLDINEKGGVAQLYVNGPFRNGGNCNSDNHGFHENDRRHYEVTYNLTVHVPRASALMLHTVNGSIKAEETTGKLDIRSVNGTIALTNMAGGGTVDTVNGKMSATFKQNPSTDLAFKTVNGRIDATFQPNLSANLHVKTFNGAAYTDFDTTAVATTPTAEIKADGRRVIRNRDTRLLRVGNGGPDYKFETLNGGIEIHKAH